MEFGNFLDKWREYLKADAPRTDSHLNQANNEYSEEDLRGATQDFAKSCLLGSGSFGRVYKGTMKDGTQVAIKVLQVPAEGGFEDEVRVLSRFRHPNLVILMGFARHAATGWRSLIYEYCAGGDVARRLHRSKQRKELFGVRERVSAALDAACGLSHLHNMTPRAFHRDIKSQNILLDKNGTAKMADFGLSCLSSASQHKVHRVGGTVGYACPEYIRTGLITEGAEVYSFGMVIFELLTGMPPAVKGGSRPGEFSFLMDYLKGSPEKVQQMLDQTGSFSPRAVEVLSELGFRCTRLPSEERPLFKQLVEELRSLLACLAPPGRPTEVVAAPAAAPTTAEIQQPFAIGTVVEARFRGGPHWFQGFVVNHNANGTPVVRYNDGQEEDVPLASLRAAPETCYAVLAPEPVPAAWPASAVSASSLPATLVIDAAPLPSLQLKCVYSEGVDVNALPEVHRVAAAQGPELVIGRTEQAPAFWDALVPQMDLQTRVSRKHFAISCRRLPLVDGRSSPALFVRCLSRNGLLVNGRYFGSDEAEQRIDHGAEVGIGIEAPAPEEVRPASLVSVATAAAWSPPTMKAFLVFRVEVLDQSESKQSEPHQSELKTLVSVAQQAVVIGQATPVALPRASGRHPSTGTAASLYPASQLDSMPEPPECFALQKDSQLCQSPLVKFFKSQMGS